LPPKTTLFNDKCQNYTFKIVALLCKISLFTFFSSYLCTPIIIVMVDKRTLEFILTDQQEEILRKS
jgi:hypothetical protein